MNSSAHNDLVYEYVLVVWTQGCKTTVLLYSFTLTCISALKSYVLIASIHGDMIGYFMHE